MEDIIRKFLELQDGYSSGSGHLSGTGYGSGSGCGSGDGNGHGSGHGSGYGYSSGSGFNDDCGDDYGDDYGDGSGHGSGDGDGSGTGEGNGYSRKLGVSAYSGHTVHYIDGLPTLIDRVHGNVARGSILHIDLAAEPCFIVKNERYFAHGSTLEEDREALIEKIMESMDPDEAIEKFMQEFKSDTKAYPASSFYVWHHYLTGSCEAGRNAFARDHGINVSKDLLTVRQFIELTRDAYGGNIIKALEDRWRKERGWSKQ